MDKNLYFIAILIFSLLCFCEYLYVLYRFFWAGGKSDSQYIKSICFSLVGLGSVITICSSIGIIIFSGIFYLSLIKHVAIHVCLLMIFSSKLLQWHGIDRVLKSYPEYQAVLKHRHMESLILYVLVVVELIFLLYFLNRIYFFW